MKKCLIAVLLFTLFGCNSKIENNSFSVNGQIKGVENQIVYLEQIYFNNEPPAIIDSAVLKKGKLSLTGKCDEEGLFRIRLSNPPAGFIFINDDAEIKLNADINNETIDGFTFTGNSNAELKNFLKYVETQRKIILESNGKIENFKSIPNPDSAINAEREKTKLVLESFNAKLIQYIDTVSDPVVAMFALGYSKDIASNKLNPIVTNLAKRFPDHTGIINLVDYYNKVAANETNLAQETATNGPAIGSIAPNLTMNDVNGKPFSLNSLRGKYVLVDFWASWCGPCRGENPNVVAAFQKFKTKNFTVLGVSLDKNKEDWINAIKSDQLTWTQISDLKYWNSEAVALYKFDGIPFNVLVDPTGKIIAKDLRESALERKLSEVLQQLPSK